MRDRGPTTPGELIDVHAGRVRSAKRLLKRSFRELDGAFLAEGAQAVREALVEAARDGGPRIRELFVTADARARHAELMAAAADIGVPVQLASGRVLAELSETVTPQGLVAVCDLVGVSLDHVLEQQRPDADKPAIIVVLAAVRDPGNAGTVLRTADAAGVAAVVFSDSSVDPYNGKCVRASAGSVFHLPIVVGVGVLDAMAAFRRAGFQILAADGMAGADNLDELASSGVLAARTVWVFGNEAWGLPDDVIRAADRTVAVPIHGRAESLNLAAAAAVCLYASARAQRVEMS